jgi:hypothetical protein
MPAVEFKKCSTGHLNEVDLIEKRLKQFVIYVWAKYHLYISEGIILFQVHALAVFLLVAVGYYTQLFQPGWYIVLMIVLCGTFPIERFKSKVFCVSKVPVDD